MAFTSQESGRPEVYVTTFPDHRQTWPLTTEGGRVLSWSDDGREILVATLSGHIAGYPVSTDGGFSHGQPTTLVRDVGAAAAVQLGHARSFPHPHPRESGRREGQGRDSAVVRLAGCVAPGQPLTTLGRLFLPTRSLLTGAFDRLFGEGYSSLIVLFVAATTFAVTGAWTYLARVFFIP